MLPVTFDRTEPRLPNSFSNDKMYYSGELQKFKMNMETDCLALGTKHSKKENCRELAVLYYTNTWGFGCKEV